MILKKPSASRAGSTPRRAHRRRPVVVRRRVHHEAALLSRRGTSSSGGRAAARDWRSPETCGKTSRMSSTPASSTQQLLRRPARSASRVGSTAARSGHLLREADGPMHHVLHHGRRHLRLTSVRNAALHRRAHLVPPWPQCCRLQGSHSASLSHRTPAKCALRHTVCLQGQILRRKGSRPFHLCSMTPNETRRRNERMSWRVDCPLHAP